MVALLARLLLPFSITLLVVCILAAVIGFPTCDTETGTCPTWHQWFNTLAFFGIGVFFVSSVVLLVIAVAAPPHRDSRARKL